ncbi:hypothetical protein EDD37DRAFT_665733 [Exophiala viscosa]|uniref:Uncharacterized protein n=1 Tax=Exophiala viscosa TaxID=2486360 RepID=A0AAN6DYH0_9EURO|nr:hypothetical protein EDD36DRAFT_485321 [Exophiala viscosa]KAI1624137.1 hypothetical protein EDD37DRAFT_665733 [Exophiala viscosa]
MSDTNTGIVWLVSSSNFVDWHHTFIRSAKDKDVWDLLIGKYKPILTEPDPDDEKYKPQTVTISTEDKDDIRVISEHRHLSLQSTSASGATTASPTSIVLRDNTAFARFQHDHNEYKEGQKTIEAARALIESAVSPFIAALIRNKDDPVEAYKFLQETYKPSESDAYVDLFQERKDTTLRNFNCERWYLRQQGLRDSRGSPGFRWGLPRS